MYVLKTWNGKEYVPWTSGTNPSNINKLIDLHKIMYPGKPYVVDKVR
jgi:hypothetical protein